MWLCVKHNATARNTPMHQRTQQRMSAFAKERVQARLRQFARFGWTACRCAVCFCTALQLDTLLLRFWRLAAAIYQLLLVASASCAMWWVYGLMRQQRGVKLAAALSNCCCFCCCSCGPF